MKRGIGTGQWGGGCWEEKYVQPYEVPRQAGWVVSGRFFLPPPIVDITLLDGLWDEVNSELGTLFDMAEEEDVGPDALPRMAEIIQGFVEQHYGGRTGKRRMRVGEQTAPRRRVLIAKMSYADLTSILQEFSRFLVDAGQKGKVVIVSL